MYKSVTQTNLGPISSVHYVTSDAIRKGYRIAYNEKISPNYYRLCFHKLVTEGCLILKNVTITRIEKGVL